MDPQSRSVAPEVDLRKRGVSGKAILIILWIGLAIFLGQRPKKSAQQDEFGDDVSGEESGEEDSQGMRLLRSILQVSQFGFFLFASMIIMLVARQRSIMYVPVPPGATRSPRENPRPYRSPRFWGIQYKDVMIESKDGTKIHAWLMLQKEQKNPEDSEDPFTVIFFHGNAGNIGHRMENFRDMYGKLRVNILAVEYRGFGDSEDGGGPSEQAFVADAVAAYCRSLKSNCSSL
eukprot:gnl/MRDRNA2_/MRDRNA2_65431_c0_seq4.p1 gnl/MRDRNA2_/MRDRNA2_65431_c0~~gnl/MRDRNA2_/MRDRNA2_65431_c0_seq4.p1  ORF type:complete len:251 (+),score=40.16 gnl/MRDRNA2_/MRDRNA2_65431_c0_seq4:59-754(+)